MTSLLKAASILPTLNATVPFASWNGTAPLDASFGDQKRHRLSRAGNRRINHVLHIMAIVQLRHDTQGRAYCRRKLAAAKTPMEAMRCLKRRLSDVVHKQMIKDATAARTGPGGHVGVTLHSSAADPIPMVNTSEQPLPGPAEPQPRTPLPRRLLLTPRGAVSVRFAACQCVEGRQEETRPEGHYGLKRVGPVAQKDVVTASPPGRHWPSTSALSRSGSPRSTS
ncbi:zinc finger domain-containing protein [Micromonospora sp. RTP1Z1]|uniref:zinc finger domain-containing protein n=1 Tax=Micromonospora sp. RTP1Z1 TaxID=2994043 RepID=UPI0029C93C51|nr:transposase [Micromonospora sp. RTP1Z1]